MQLLHAEAVQRGASLQWAAWLDPAPELLERFDHARASGELQWSDIEPQFVNP